MEHGELEPAFAPIVESTAGAHRAELGPAGPKRRQNLGRLNDEVMARLRDLCRCTGTLRHIAGAVAPLRKKGSLPDE